MTPENLDESLYPLNNYLFKNDKPMIRRLFNKIGVSSLEYIMLILIVGSVSIASEQYASRAISGKWKSVGDSIGFQRQYNPRTTLACVYDPDTDAWYDEACVDANTFKGCVPDPLCVNPVPQDGGWCAWSNWSQCSAPCDGKQTHSRICQCPAPANGGATCPGAAVEDQDCGPTCSACVPQLGVCTPGPGPLICGVMNPGAGLDTCGNPCDVPGPPCPSRCGDGICNGTENCTNCPQDCPTCPPPVCGDRICDPTENCTTCPQDCGVCPPVCPDGICNGTEDCKTCPADCGVCPPVCGDGVCNGTETCTTCPADCGTCVCGPCNPTSGKVICGIDNPGTDSCGSCVVTGPLCCSGTVPPNSTLCPGDDQTGLTTQTPITAVVNCSSAKCEYQCNSGFVPDLTRTTCVLARCLPDVPKGLPPLNSSVCPTAPKPLTDTLITLVANCSGPPPACAYSCDPGYIQIGNLCTLSQCNGTFPLHSTLCSAGGSGVFVAVDHGQCTMAPCECQCDLGYVEVGNSRCVAAQCTGTHPNNASVCPGDDQGLLADTPITTVATCVSNAIKCEYACDPGYVPLGMDRCVKAQCINTPPSNSALCPNDDQGLITDTPITLAPDCSNTTIKCKYICNAPFYLYDSISNSCVLASGACPTTTVDVGGISPITVPANWNGASWWCTDPPYAGCHCLTGYHFSLGTPNMACISGNWTPNPPDSKCVPDAPQCPATALPGLGTVSLVTAPQTPSGQTWWCTDPPDPACHCPTGYHFDLGTPDMYCDNGNWTPNPPDSKCVLDPPQCPATALPGLGTISLVTAPKTPSGQTWWCTDPPDPACHCPTGHVFDLGTPTMYCDNGNWTPNPPDSKCVLAARDCLAVTIDIGTVTLITVPLTPSGQTWWWSCGDPPGTGCNCPSGQGFNLGTPFMNCNDGTWTPNPPDSRCVPGFCPQSVMDIGDGLFGIFPQVAIGEWSTSVCPPGSTQISTGPPRRLCLSSGALDTTLTGGCLRIPGFCPAATMPVGSGQMGLYPITASGSQGTSTCPSGFSGNPTMTCTAGVWDLSSLINPCLPNCPTSLPVFANATPSGSGFSEGSTWTYQCNRNFTGGSSTIVCHNTVWQDPGGGPPVDPKCVPLMCPVAPTYPNATATGTGVGQGDTRTYICNLGFVGQTLTIMCDNGQWIDILTGQPPGPGGPNCHVPSTCPAAPAYPNATASGTGVNEGDTRVYTCDLGFKGSVVTLICSAGQWLDIVTRKTSTGPNCIANRCLGSIPADATLCPNADQDLTADTQIKTVSVCTSAKCEYRCNAGFYPSSAQDRCVAAVCTGTQDVNSSLCPGAQPSIDTPVRLVSVCSSTVVPCEFICKSGYVLVGIRCVQAQCTNTIANSKPCPGPAPTVDTPSTLVFTCSGSVPCEFICSSGFTKTGNLCL